MSRYRNASHAGSWYKNNGKELNKELEGWLAKASLSHGPAKAIIAPHAGFAYSGPCAAFAYKQIDPSLVKRIFLLGPSHHVHLDSCALTNSTFYNTPLYNLTIDLEVTSELSGKGGFERMDAQMDEDEHSLEMHLPYIAKIMENHQNDFKLVPILVGSISFKKEQEYAHILAPYFTNPENLFIFSSDFCHWGSRFRYTLYDKADGDIWQSIKKLDHIGMGLIESIDHKGFHTYLKQFQNTICGRHPISILLAILVELKSHFSSTLNFLQYAQSNRCHSTHDSSVSYASASLTIQKSNK